jgi:hypothetical protein
MRLSRKNSQTDKETLVKTRFAAKCNKKRARPFSKNISGKAGWNPA